MEGCVMEEVGFNKEFREQVCPKLGEYAGKQIDKQILRSLGWFPDEAIESLTNNQQ